MPLDREKIKAVMAARKIGPTELARRCGYAPPNISRILGGAHVDPRLSTVERLAAALRCPIAQLLT